MKIEPDSSWPLCLWLAPSDFAKTISVLIVDGQNNHNWAAMTRS